MTELPQPTRRQFGIGLATLSIGTGAALTLGTENASAQVTADSPGVHVPEASHGSTEGSVWDVWLEIQGNWQFSTGEQADAWRIDLFVGRGAKNYQQIAQTGGGVVSNEMASTYSVSGKLSDSPDWDRSDFEAPGDNQQVSYTVPIRVVFSVLGMDGSVITDSDVETNTGLSIADTGIATIAQLDGEGQLSFQVDESDSPPV